MKIAWFTPFEKKSAIGKYSQIASNVISNKHEVDLWVTENEYKTHETKLSVIKYNPKDIYLQNKLNTYDVVIYNFGDDFKFHKDIFEVYLKVPGIVILHDYLMQHFFLSYFYVNNNLHKSYIDSIKLIYGDNVKPQFEKSFAGKSKIPIWETNEIDKYPFIEPLFINARGIIVHSNYTKKLVEDKYPGIIIKLDPPYNNREYRTQPYKTLDMHNKSKKIRLLTLGHVNNNKRLDKIIEVIGNNDVLRKNIRYDIIGTFDKEGPFYKYLLKLIRKYSLEEIIILHGYLVDMELFQYLIKSDICINLRYPVMCGCSWSLLDEFNAKKPIIVSDIGFFSELPDDVVIKIPVNGFEKKVLEEKLLLMVQKYNLRMKIGNKGNEYFLKTYNENVYLRDFEKFINLARSDREIQLLIKVSKEAGSFTNELLNENEIFNTVNSVLEK